jgi:protein tyrosine phosphatase (PTP) superfamily phosphohydrolase (DUF442 family)
MIGHPPASAAISQQQESMISAEVRVIHNFRNVDCYISTSGQPSADQLAAAARDGFTVVINLALHGDPRYSLPDEEGLVISLGMEYVHIPVQFASPAEDDAFAFFSAMEHHQGKKLLVHCAANKRVTAFLGLYRVIRQGWEPVKAFELMKSVWEPDDVWSAFISAMLAKHHG